MNPLLIRRRGMMQGGLPYDSKISYLESAGAQYIDTGILGNQPKSVKLRMLAPVTNYYVCVIGSLVPANPSTKRFAPMIINSSKLVGVTYYQTSATGGKNLSTAMSDAIPFEVQASLKKNAQTSRVKLDTEATFSSHTWSDTHDCASDYSMFLFAANNGSGAQSYTATGTRLYWCQIFDSDDYTNMVRDFIPVRVGQVGYMYDRVSGQLFGNAGTGNFILGPDVQ